MAYKVFTPDTSFLTREDISYSHVTTLSISDGAFFFNVSSRISAGSRIVTYSILPSYNPLLQSGPDGVCVSLSIYLFHVSVLFNESFVSFRAVQIERRYFLNSLRTEPVQYSFGYSTDTVCN